MLALLLGLFAASAHAETPWVLLPEPRFMGHQVTQPIEGSKNTVLAAAQVSPEFTEFARREQWAALGISDAALMDATRKQAAEWLQQAKVDLTRDKKNVVEFATVHSESVPAAATVLAPEFWQKFEQIFGPKMRVVIPNRQTIYIFPDLESDLDQYARMIFTAWRSRWPKVSLEVFELNERGLRAIGAFEEP